MPHGNMIIVMMLHTINPLDISNSTFDLILVLIAVSRNEGSDESCKCADSRKPLLFEYTKYGYIDADSYQN